MFAQAFPVCVIWLHYVMLIVLTTLAIMSSKQIVPEQAAHESGTDLFAHVFSVCVIWLHYVIMILLATLANYE